jgi:predicted DCC family thiol-disulfide oxidoreductase YuxK
MPISVFTEITDANPRLLGGPVGDPRRGWILYDGECGFCLSIVRRTRGIFAPRGFAFLPLQTPWVRAVFNLPERELLAEMRLLPRNGEKLGGADAILKLAEYVWWAWPMAALAYVPGARRLLRMGYRYIAARRNCIAGTCSIPAQSPREIAREQRRI